MSTFWEWREGMARLDEIEANKQLCRQFFVHLENSDVDAAFALCEEAEGCGWMDPRRTGDQPSSSYPDRRRALRWFLSQMKDGIHFDVQRITAEDDRVAMQMAGRAAMVNGRDYDQIYHMLFEVESGRIRRIWEYADPIMTMHALEGLERPS
jgi:hypothetical protein